MKFIFGLMFMCLVTSCRTMNLTTRVLSQMEMNKHHLNGVVTDAKICPTEFNESSQSLKIIGTCELVTCQNDFEKLTCTARPELR